MLGMIAYTPARWWAVVCGLWLSQSLIIISSNALNFALIWQLTTQTASAQAVGWAAALSLLPGVLLTPIAGVLSDRWPRQHIMRIAEVVSAVPLVWLIFQGDTIPPWAIYVLVVWRAMATALHQTAFQAMLPQLIPPQHLQRLSGTQQLVLGISSFVTPVLGALIVATYGVHWATQWVLWALVLSVLFLSVIRFPTMQMSVAPTRWQDDFVIVRDVFVAQRGLLHLIAAAVVLNMCLLPIFSLLPYMVSSYFQAGPWLLAWLELAGGVGLLGGAVTLAVWGGFRRVPVTLAVAVALLIVAMLATAATPADWPWLMLAAMGIIGWAAAWAHGPLLTLVQYNTPAQMHGRAMAVLQTAMNAAAPLGIVLTGWLVDTTSVRLWAMTSVLIVSMVLIIAVRGPIMTLQSPLPVDKS